MKPTNKSNLPQVIYQALSKDYYNYIPWKNEYSATELLNPPKYTLLQRRHRDEIQEDVADLFYRTYGSIMHQWLENINTENALKEERLKRNLDKYIITGKPDLYVDRILYDYKMTTVWTWIYESRLEEWTAKANIYNWLLFGYDFKADFLKNIIFFRDWNKSKYEREKDKGYPRQCEILELDMWDYDETEDYIRQRLQSLAVCEALDDDSIPPCSPEDRWQDKTKWAVMKDGRKSAVRVLDSSNIAGEYIEDNKSKGTLKIEKREGVPKRCIDYCSVNGWCSFWNEYKKEVK